MWSLSTNVTDGQTDGRTNRQTCDSKTSLCIVVHHVIKTCFYIQSYIPRRHEIKKQYTDKLVPVLPSSENISTAPILYTQCLPEKYSFSCILGGVPPSCHFIRLWRKYMLTGLNNRHGLSYRSVSHEQNFPGLFPYDPEAPRLSDSFKCWRNLAKSFPVENLSAVAACFIIGSKSLRYRFDST